MIRNCEQCGIGFTPIGRKAKFQRLCSDACSSREWRARRKPKTLACLRCGIVRPASEFANKRGYLIQNVRYCSECKKVREAERRQRKPILRRQCYLNRDKEATKAYARNQHRQYRQRVLDAYGGACACCGESELLFLTVDHVNNDGAEHRRQRRSSGYDFYRWLRVRGYPKDGYQLLCFNCNMAKAFYGSCPHTQEARSAVA